MQIGCGENIKSKTHLVGRLQVTEESSVGGFGSEGDSVRGIQCAQQGGWSYSMSHSRMMEAQHGLRLVFAQHQHGEIFCMRMLIDGQLSHF